MVPVEVSRKVRLGKPKLIEKAEAGDADMVTVNGRAAKGVISGWFV